MQPLFLPLVILCAAIFAYAPLAIANAPYESTMLPSPLVMRALSTRTSWRSGDQVMGIS